MNFIAVVRSLKLQSFLIRNSEKVLKRDLLSLLTVAIIKNRYDIWKIVRTGKNLSIVHIEEIQEALLEIGYLKIQSAIRSHTCLLKLIFNI